MNFASLVAAANGDIRSMLIANTPGGIEQQEAEGQRELVNSTDAATTQSEAEWISAMRSKTNAMRSKTSLMRSQTESLLKEASEISRQNDEIERQNNDLFDSLASSVRP
jgi:hypothetical protein